jgi:hypothetical protein
MKSMEYRVGCIDMAAFASKPESHVIVRLMWALNEMNQLADLGRMVEKAEEESPHLWKYYEGITGTLTRLRSSRVSEVLQNVVRQLVDPGARKKFPELCRIISSDAKLRALRGKIRTLFQGKRKKLDFERHRQIRHRISEHFDHISDKAVIPDALTVTIAQKKKLSKAAVIEGWIIQGISPGNKQVARFLLADEVLTTAWRENILRVPQNKKGYSKSRQAQRAKRFTLEFMATFHAFAGRLIDIYLKNHKLWIDCNPDDLLTFQPKRKLT